MMANKLPLMFLLAIALSPARGYICNSNTSLPRDDFENHGCFCDTETVANHSNESRHLFFTYEKAFAGCHETEGDVTIECAFLESEAPILKRLFNRTSLSEIPVIDKDGVYEDVTCLLLSGNSISSITHQQMRQFPKLKAIYLNYNLGIKIDPDAFDSNPDLINMYQEALKYLHLFCTKNSNGDYCLRLLDNIQNGVLQLPIDDITNCDFTVPTGRCSNACKNVATWVKTKLGCCYDTFKQTDQIPAEYNIPDDFFTKCNQQISAC